MADDQGGRYPRGYGTPRYRRGGDQSPGMNMPSPYRGPPPLMNFGGPGIPPPQQHYNPPMTPQRWSTPVRPPLQPSFGGDFVPLSNPASGSGYRGNYYTPRHRGRGGGRGQWHHHRGQGGRGGGYSTPHHQPGGRGRRKEQNMPRDHGYTEEEIASKFYSPEILQDPWENVQPILIKSSSSF